VIRMASTTAGRATSEQDLQMTTPMRRRSRHFIAHGDIIEPPTGPTDLVGELTDRVMVRRRQKHLIKGFMVESCRVH